MRTGAHRRMEAAATILARIVYNTERGLIDKEAPVSIGGIPVCSQGMLKMLLEQIGEHSQFEPELKKQIARIRKGPIGGR